MSAVLAAEDSSYSFEFEHAGLFNIAARAAGDRAIISRKAKAKTQCTAADLRQFRDIAQHDPVIRLPISVGIANDGGLILAADVPDDNFDLQLIEIHGHV